MRSLASMGADEARGFKYVLTDVDDTITSDEKLLDCTYHALWALHDAGLKIIPITGGPAGKCDLYCRQWPVDAAIGENGATVFFMENGRVRRIDHPTAVPNTDVRLKAILEQCLKAVPQCRLASDQYTRLFDMAINYAEDEPRLGVDQARTITEICLANGAHAMPSSIHVNVWLGDYDKRSMATMVLKSLFGWDPSMMDEVVYLGDAPNDEPMFEFFTHTIGVASIRKYEASLTHKPVYIADKAGGEGFAQAAMRILELRSAL